MVRALRALGADVGWFLPGPDRRRLRPVAATRCAGSPAAAPGCWSPSTAGSRRSRRSRAARAAGIDVVVTDHHAPRARRARCPTARSSIPAVCGYPCAELCGTAVAYKLAQALGAPRRPRRTSSWSRSRRSPTWCRFAARTGGSCARGWRRCREHGEARPASADGGRAGRSERARRARARVPAGAADQRRRAAAAGRRGPRAAADRRRARAAEIAAELDRVNAERRAVEQRIVWEAEAQVAELGGARAAYVLAGEGWHPGVIGIVASRIVERYHRPAILIALDGDGWLTGSGRSIPGFDLLGALHAVRRAPRALRRPPRGRRPDRSAASGSTSSAGAIERHAEEVLTPELLSRVERVDAVVSGSELGLELAEELELLEPCGIGQPRAAAARARRAVRATCGRWGRGGTLRFSVSSGGGRARGGRVRLRRRVSAVEPGEPVDATLPARAQRLERRGRAAPRARATRGRARRARSRCWASPRTTWRRRSTSSTGRWTPSAEPEPPASAARTRARPPRREPAGGARRRGLGRRRRCWRSAPTCRAGSSGLARADRRLRAGLLPRARPRPASSATAFAQLVALDPPAGADGEGRCCARATGFTHLAWGEAELRFAEQMHELEYGLRASLVALYRGLRHRGRVAGEELEHLLRGDGPHGRPARLAGRLIRVLAELELVSLDRDLPALALAGAAPTALERSPAYRVYAQRYEDGRRFLSSANHPPGAPEPRTRAAGDGTGSNGRGARRELAAVARRPRPPVDRARPPPSAPRRARSSAPS